MLAAVGIAMPILGVIVALAVDHPKSRSDDYVAAFVALVLASIVASATIFKVVRWINDRDGVRRDAYDPDYFRNATPFPGDRPQLEKPDQSKSPVLRSDASVN